jgi:hypothetical protein
MEVESLSDRAPEASELVIDLDLQGLAALLVTIEKAMESGRARLQLGGTGIAARGGGTVGPYPILVVTFPQPRDDARDGIPARAAPARLLEPAD